LIGAIVLGARAGRGFAHEPRPSERLVKQCARRTRRTLATAGDVRRELVDRDEFVASAAPRSWPTARFRAARRGSGHAIAPPRWCSRSGRGATPPDAPLVRFGLRAPEGTTFKGPRRWRSPDGDGVRGIDGVS
jgi:hypothetical protein